MKRNQTFHETLIPLLVEGIGARSYLEFGTYKNETISRVRCERRIGVDTAPIENISDIEFYRTTTAEFIREHAARLAPFDFVFIDADHSADAVEADLWGIWPHIAPEGLVCLHDTNPETEADTIPGLCGDCWRLLPLLPSSGWGESVTLPYHPGLTIIRKRVKWGP